MEALNQSYGFVLYEHTAASAVQGQIQPGDWPRDRVLVYVNGQRVGVIDRIYAAPATVEVELKKGDVLQLLVENLGRVDYGPAIVEQIKGIVGNVTVGGNVLTNWAMYSLQLDELPAIISSPAAALAPSSTNSPPIFYRGSFQVDAKGSTTDPSRDTFLSLPDGIKGVVWVNGNNLGRY
ncbi:hypothetical protein VTN77DRAFT_138 [Rasamsonia byssochlamydoides]|uniref:uncharacterized protein n=1 Tax=Rasamsonia byssochlamydoides TaxID=89139 RepID=UPI003743725E